MNSLYVLLAFMAFTLFGYLSLVRILYKYQFGTAYPSLADWKTAFSTGDTARRLSQSVLFVSLPSVSLLLYWGWAPAMLWLVIGHLLIDTIVSVLVSSPKMTTSAAELYSDYSDSHGGIRAIVSQLTIMMLISVVIVFLANMIDQQTGLLFALLGVLISIHLLRSASGAMDAVLKLLASIGLLLLGLTLAHQMGISVFGNWAPLADYVPWLKFDNRTLLALFLLVSAVRLSDSTSLQKGLQNAVMIIIIGLLLILVGSLVWQQPLLDAPMLSSNERSLELPAFAGIFLLLSATSIAVLSQLVRRGVKPQVQENPKGTFLQQQSLNLFLLIFCIATCLWLASAGGIGAWNTHYTSWPDGVTLQKHFSLVLRTIAFASNTEATTANVPFTLLVIAFCLIGVTAVLGLLKILKTKSLDAVSVTPQESTLVTAILGKTTIQYGLMFIGCCWLLSNGIPTQLWVLTMVLCWLMVSDILLWNVAELKNADLSALLSRGFVVVLFTVGALQTLWIGVSLAMNNEMVYALGHLVALLLAGILSLGNLIDCLKGLRKRPEEALFTRDV